MGARNCVVTYDPLSARYAERLRTRLGCAFEQVVVSDVGGQPFLIVAASWDLALRRAMLSERHTGSDTLNGIATRVTQLQTLPRPAGWLIVPAGRSFGRE